MRPWASSEGTRNKRKGGQEEEKNGGNKEGGGERDTGMQVYGLGCSSPCRQRCESVNEFAPSFLGPESLRDRQAGDGGSCVPCPPLGHPLRCGDKGDFAFQPVGEPTKV